MAEIEGLEYTSISDYVRNVMEYVPWCHGYSHIRRVSFTAMDIAEREGLDQTYAWCIRTAALLHDIGRAREHPKIGQVQIRTPHAHASAEMAMEFFDKYSQKSWFSLYADRVDTYQIVVTPRLLDIVVQAIAEHSRREPASTIVGQVLQDADKIDALGYVGFCRLVQYVSDIDNPEKLLTTIKDRTIEGYDQKEIDKVIIDLENCAEWYPDMFHTLEGKKRAFNPWLSTKTWLIVLKELSASRK